jgi:hypothetical protein
MRIAIEDVLFNVLKRNPVIPKHKMYAILCFGIIPSIRKEQMTHQ